MTDEKPKGRKALGRDDRLDEADLMSRKRQCPATSKRTGERCKRYCAPGARTCKFHGSATRRAKTAAAKRVAQASGYAADMLVEFMADPEVDIKLRTNIAQDLLDRSGVSAKTVLQIGVEPPKSFEDWVGDAVVELDVVPDETVAAYNPPRTRDLEVLDAEVVEDDPPLMNRHDRKAFHEASRRSAPRQNELHPDEAAIFAEQEQRRSRGRVIKGREAYLRALDAGATHEQAEEAGRMAADGIKPNVNRPRRARQSTADWG